MTMATATDLRCFPFRSKKNFIKTLMVIMLIGLVAAYFHIHDNENNIWHKIKNADIVKEGRKKIASGLGIVQYSLNIKPIESKCNRSSEPN